MKDPTILTIDIKHIGATTLWEIRDALAKEHEATKDSDNQSFHEMAVASGVSLKQLDTYLEKMDVRRP